MSKENDGGPAFPVQIIETQAHGIIPSDIQGMSLRDYFAAHASEQDILNQPDAKTRQEARYMFADAMLKAREE